MSGQLKIPKSSVDPYKPLYQRIASQRAAERMDRLSAVERSPRGIAAIVVGGFLAGYAIGKKFELRKKLDRQIEDTDSLAFKILDKIDRFSLKDYAAWLSKGQGGLQVQPIMRGEGLPGKVVVALYLVQIVYDFTSPNYSPQPAPGQTAGANNVVGPVNVSGSAK